MIKVLHKLEEIEYKFPKNEITSAISHTLKLFSPVTSEEYSFDLEDSGAYNDFYVFTTDFTSVKDGEYVYIIDGKETGLMIVGENYETKREQKKSYNNDNKITQYEG